MHYLSSSERSETLTFVLLMHSSTCFLDERDGLSTSLEQSQKMVQTCSTELNKLKGQLAAAYQQINALQGGKEEVNGFYTFIFHSLNVRPILDIALYLRGVITMMYHKKASFSVYMI